MDTPSKPMSYLGLTRKETQRWSLVRTLRAIEQDPLRMPGAEFEKECSDAIARDLNRPPRPGFLFMPLEVQQRSLIVGTAAQGGYLVGTSSYIPGASFASALRAQDPLAAFNIERIGPMLGDFGMPQVSTAPVAQWLSENGTATAAAPVYTSQHATPKTCASFFQFSRQLEKQAPPEVLDAIVIAESARSVSAAVAAAFCAGSGTDGEPLGIAGLAAGTQAGTSLAYAGILNMIESVESAGLANPARAGFILGPEAATLMRTRERASGAGAILNGFEIAGYRAIVTAACPTDAIVFGDWSRAGLAEWGLLEVGADPFTSFQSGIIGVRALYSVDVLALQPSSFAVSTAID